MNQYVQDNESKSEIESKSDIKSRIPSRTGRTVRGRKKEIRAAFNEISSYIFPLACLGFLIWLLFHHSIDMGMYLYHNYAGSSEVLICYNIDLIKFIQAAQFKRARLEVFGQNKIAFHVISGDDMGFYDRNFGAMIINARR